MNFNKLVDILEGSYYGISTQQQNAGGRRIADNQATANLGLGLTSGSGATNRSYTPSESEEHQVANVRKTIDGIITIIDSRIENIKETEPGMRFAVQQLESLRSEIESMH